MSENPRFGDDVINDAASDDNPQKKGQFVRFVRRTGRMNPGLSWEITDGNGKFWEVFARFCRVVDPTDLED